METLNQFVSHNEGVLLLLGIVVVLGALTTALRSAVVVSTMSKRFVWATGETSPDSETLPALLRSVDANARDIGALKNDFQQAEIDARAHLQKHALVRFDAFDGVAGQQSYSLCLLDEHDNGFLITSLVGSNFSRGYAVDIREGKATRKLGDEEARALETAVRNSH